MVALREELSSERHTDQGPPSDAEAARWMSLRHASCRLDVCPSTLRRRIRKGQLPWRVVNHGRRWAYEVLVPNGAPPCAELERVVSMEAHLPHQVDEKEKEINRLKYDIRRQEEQIENLSQALARARAGNRYTAEDSPFTKYRELALRRRRWWLF
jgi:hypothetical protein